MSVTTAFCSRCQKTLYLETGASTGCPVCSTPLVEIEAADSARSA